ncbi:MAG: hypothetical protein ACRCYY_15395 [Trueperaceae bacterium]
MVASILNLQILHVMTLCTRKTRLLRGLGIGSAWLYEGVSTSYAEARNDESLVIASLALWCIRS